LQVYAVQDRNAMILIVEDNATFRSSLKDMLTTRFPTAGIREASDGDEALRKASEERPDLILMDIKLPGMNGLEVTRAIKDADAGARIIIFTSYDIPEYREAAYRSGACHYFVKGSARSDEIAAAVESELSIVGKGCVCSFL
jgi:DNA-binding NarL/FixJ family response regulator